MPYSNIDKPNQYFSTNLWVADDTSPRTFSGFGHKPDFVWVKHRGTSSLNHTLVDRVRGGDKMIFSNATTVEDTKSHGEITSWNTDGITVADGTNGTYPRLYFNDLDPFGSGGGNYVCWSWSGSGTTPVSNTAGTITSTVSANTTSGFSIVTWVDNASTYTVGHGLGVAPKFIILKDRGTTYNWDVGCDSIGWANRLILNSTSASGAGYWNSTAPTSSVFTYIGNGTSNMVAYCFAEVKGFSKFGSYKGNGAVDGPFVYTGFKPAFVVIKRSDGTGNWIMFDNKRPNYNVIPFGLFPNSNNAEVNDVQYYGFDLLSNGFKIRNTVAYGGEYNEPNGNMIYMAFAENPFVSSKSIPTTAR
jgi:hypothetical protein